MGCCTGYNFAPAPDAALDPNQRVNFTFGMVLGVDDFRQEHAWLAERDERALRELIGYGAITGLNVTTVISGTQVEVRVAPGLALLPDGKLVGIAASQCARLDEWLTGPGKPAATQSGPASVYVVLRHVETTGTPVPIPGEPCRDESALLADSRIADSFTLDFSWTPPAQTEDNALRIFTTWLRRVEIRSAPVPEMSLADFQAAVEAQVTAAIANAAAAFSHPPLAETPRPNPDPGGGSGDSSPPGSPPDGSPPGSPPDASPPGTGLVIPREHYAAYVNAAFDVWVRRLRTGLMAHFGPVPKAEDSAEAGLLLAAIDIGLDAGNLLFPAAPASPAVARWLGRAQLVHLRLLQEWLITSIENDAPVDADYVLGRGDPRLPGAQDLSVDFASDDHALARIDLVPSPTPGEASALKAVLRPAVKWPGGAAGSGGPDYYGPGMGAPIPVSDGGTGQNADPTQGQLLVGVAAAGGLPAAFQPGALRPVEHALAGGSMAANLKMDVASAAPDLLIDTIQNLGPLDNPQFAGLAVNGAASADSLTLGTPLGIAAGGSGQAALPQRLQVLVGDHDGSDGRFVLARLVDSPTVTVTLQQSGGSPPAAQDWQIVLNTTGDGGSNIDLPLKVSQGGTGQTTGPAPGQILTGDAAGNFAVGNLRPATRGRHIAVAQAGADLTIDTTRQTHWATRIVEEERNGLKDDDHVVLLVFGDNATFELGEPQDERVVVIKSATSKTIASVVRKIGDPNQEPFIDDEPLLVLKPLQAVTLIGSKKLRRWLVIGRA
jgi:hypothetical protein